MAGEKPFYMTRNTGFAPYDESAELLHPEQNRLVEDISCTETQYFGFSVPEAGIHALTYLWHLPKTRTVTGAAWVWQGIKANAVHSELCDIRTHMSDEVLKNDIHEFRLENSYGVKVLEPLKRFHLTYSDPGRNNSFDLISEAVGPVVMFANGNHFEQAMHVKGELVLRGKRYDVDCFNVRDRSWGKPRSGAHVPLAPIGWMTGVFSKDFSFNCTVMDQASGNPELRGTQFDVPEEQTLNAGWLYRDGKLGCITHARKSVARAPGTLLPAGLDLEVTDDLDRTVAMRGRLVASCPWQNLGNQISAISLMRWECEGMVAYGDCQEAIWNDYFNFMLNR